MPPGLPHRPPLAMRLWLFRRSGGANGTASASAAPARSSGFSMSIESLEHMVRNRVRMFLRHTWLVAFLGTIMLGAAVWAGFYVTTEANHMRIAAGPVDSKFAKALSNQITKNHHSFSLQIIPTQQSKETAQAMSKGEADLAILPSNLDDSLNWPVVAIVRQNVMVLMIPASAATNKGAGSKSATSAKSGGSGKTASAGKSAKNSKSAKNAKTAKSAKSDDSDDSDDSDNGDDDSDDSGKFAKVSQLFGKRVGVVTGNEATTGLLELLLSHYGVPLTKVTVSQIDPNNLADAIKNNQIDALFVAGAAAGRAISSAVTAATVNGKPPTFVEIDQADGIAKRHPAFDSVDIDAGTFGGNPPMPSDSLKSLSFAEFLVARKSYSESVIGALSKVIYSSRQALAAALPGDIKIAAPSTDKDADIVVHPGALAYLSDSQQSFFDKYGDDIFYGMLIFPVFGSAIAGVATYLTSSSRTRRLRLLQRVLDLVRKAHAAQNVETIEQLQIDADNLVIAIIHQGEHEEFDETVRMSFAFALDQLRFTIGARRVAIIDHSAGTAAPATGTGTSAKAAAA
jgi:TRAP-type uncharacterized transport system substrate-binding protein